MANRNNNSRVNNNTRNNNNADKYNGVKVTKTWSFLGFCKEFGRPKFATCVNGDTGEEFNCLAFDKGDGELTFCHFGYSTEGMTAREISQQKRDLQVGLNTSGKYTLFKSEGGWEEIDID